MMTLVRILVLAAATWLSPCAAEVVPAAPLTSAAAPAAEFGRRFVGYLKTDSDQQAEKGLELVDAWLQAWNPEPALDIASQLQGYRRAVAYYRIATQLARAGRREAALQTRVLGDAAGNGVLDHEIQEIAASRAEALAATGELARARDALAAIVAPVVRLQTEARFFEFEPIDQLDARVREFASRAGRVPSQAGKAELFAARTLLDAGDLAAGRALLDSAFEAIARRADVETVPLLHRTVRLYLLAGDLEAARRCAEALSGFAARTDPLAYWKARDMRLAAESFYAIGDGKMAGAFLDRIPNLVNRLDAHSLGRGGSEAALAFLLQGQPDQFHAAARHILLRLRGHAHHRARAMSGIDVLTAYIQSGVPLVEAVAKELEETARSIEVDPAYIHPG